MRPLGLFVISAVLIIIGIVGVAWAHDAPIGWTSSAIGGVR